MSESVELEVIQEESRTLLTWAKGLAIVTKDDADVAVEKIAQAKGLRKKWMDYWDTITRPMRTAMDAAYERRKAGTEVIDSAERIVKNRVAIWQAEERAKAEAERKRLQAIADEQARKERERLEREAEKLKTPELKAERLEAAASVVAPVISVTADAAATSRKAWSAVLANKTELIAAAAKDGPTSPAASLVMMDQKVADALARATKGTIAIPGVQFVSRDVLSIGAR